MERVTLRVPTKQVEEVEGMVEDGDYPNRSEAIRDAIRKLVKEKRQAKGRRPRAEPWD